MTGLNPFTLTHCSPSPPCVRFAASVTTGDATLGTRCLAKASGARFFPRLTTPSFARRTLFGIDVVGESTPLTSIGCFMVDYLLYYKTLAPRSSYVTQPLFH